jgi:hypothetical protein
MQDTTPPERRPATAAGPPAIGLGAALVIIGGLLLIGQVAGIGIDDVGWPVWIIGIGLVILVSGLTIAGESGMVVGGTVVTTVGLVLLYQNATDHWESWAYAWALVGPAASGLGLALWGLRGGGRADVRKGTWGLLGGLGMFAIGFLFFEGVIGISGQRFTFADWLLPVAVIAVGAVLVIRGLLDRREPDLQH